MHVQVIPDSVRLRWKPCRYDRQQFMTQAGQPPQLLFRLESGWACNAVVLQDGRRQITGFYLAGDICDAQWVFGQHGPGSVVALTTVHAVKVPVDSLSRNLAEDTQAQGSLVRALLDRLSRQSERIVALGRKSAMERVASLLQQLYARCALRGEYDDDGRCPFPLTQVDLADATGLTPIHVNRVIKMLRERKAIAWSRGKLSVHKSELAQILDASRIGNGTRCR